MKKAIKNLTTQKLELHFNKSDYLALSTDQKSSLKSAFLWSKSGACWVSRAKLDNCYHANKTAEKLGFNLAEAETIGQRLSYAEELEVKTEKAEHRQEKYLRYAAVFALLIATLFVSERKSGIPGSQSAAIISLSKFAPTIKADNTLPTDTTKTMLQNDSAAYHVIVASLPTQQSAKNFQRFLSDNNYPTAHVLKPVKTYRVAIKSFNDKDEAIRFMENLRSSDERFATAWVLCKR